jgi:hypothetical protein
VRVLRCTGAGQEYPEISPESPDFPETPGKSPEYLGLTDKIVLSGDFQDSPIHPPLGDIKILSPRPHAFLDKMEIVLEVLATENSNHQTAVACASSRG